MLAKNNKVFLILMLTPFDPMSHRYASIFFIFIFAPIFDQKDLSNFAQQLQG